MTSRLKKLLKASSKHLNSVGKNFSNAQERNTWLTDMAKGIKKYHPKLIVTTSKKNEKHTTPIASWINYSGRVYFRKKKPKKRKYKKRKK